MLLGARGRHRLDASRHALWAGWGGGGEGDITLIHLDATDIVTSSSLAFNTCGSGDCFAAIDDGLTYDAGSDSLYVSPDVSQTIDHFTSSGTLLGSFPWAGGSCYNSGLAIGGPAPPRG